MNYYVNIEIFVFQGLGENMVEKYFQELVLVVEESIKCGAAGRANYLLKLQDIYSNIITACKKGTYSAIFHIRPS